MTRSASKRTPAASERRAAKPKPGRGKNSSRPAAAAKKQSQARVRMYRQGFGDCFLVSLPRSGSGSRPFHILIDCGVIVGTPDPDALMTKVVEDIGKATEGEIDLLVVTHEHWDHVSGFIQARKAFDKKKLKVHEVWLAWTEDPDDKLADKLRKEHDAALTSLKLSMQRMALGGNDEGAAEMEALLGLFGAKAASTRDALKVARALGKVQYKRPKDNPVQPQGVGARIYVLGPPPDEKAIRKTSPSKSNPETYGLMLDGLRANIEIEPQAEASLNPFPEKFVIPFAVAREMPFFKTHYWRPSSDLDWRRIDTAWLDDASELALQLDAKTNNTSLALAIELFDGDDREVLLFAADAQVGNWLSWHDLAWWIDGEKVTGPDLLKRTVLYKVGHHGSHNATLREKGLELMTGLRYALVPVDGAVAKKKRWSRIPLEDLISTLKTKRVTVLRVDDDPPVTLAGASPTPLYYEVDL